MQWQHQLVCAAHERRRRTVRAAREVGRPHSSSQVRSSPLISLVHCKYVHVHVNNLSSDSVVEDGFDVFIPHDAVSADECAVEVRLPLNSTRVVVVSVQVNILQCMFWSEREDLWRTSGCVVSAQHLIHALVSSAWRLTAFVCCQPGPEYSDTHQHCRCDHLTSFSGFVVPANKLDIHDKSVTFAT